MEAKRRFRAAGPLALAAALVGGCGGSADRPVAISGTITLEGKPLNGAQVTFSPLPPAPADRFGADVTGSSGYYKVMSHGRSGLPPGKYRVLISTEPEATAGAEGQAGDPIMLALMNKARANQGNVTPAELPIESAFEREVEPGGSTFDFDLKRPIPPPPPEPPAPPPKAKTRGRTKGRR